MGAITSQIDVAQVAIYMFWGFFAGLIYYLLRENKREGYPLDSDRSGRIAVQGFPAIPPAKTYLLPHGGGTQTAPRKEQDTRSLAAKPLERFPGAPLQPTGNPMLSGVGPGAWAERSDKPDLATDGRPRLVPLKSNSAFHIESRDPDPRGMKVIGADGAIGGTVTDVWVDRSEALIRYLEVETPTAEGTRQVLLPINFTKIEGARRHVKVKAILSTHFKDVPSLKSPTEVTRREEDRICAYYGAGTLYATADRGEPLL